MKGETIKVSTHVVIKFACRRYNFIVDETMDHNEGDQRDTIGSDYKEIGAAIKKIQVFCMSCPYVNTTCSSVRQDVFFHLYVVYKVVNIFNAYINSFPMVAKEEY